MPGVQLQPGIALLAAVVLPLALTSKLQTSIVFQFFFDECGFGNAKNFSIPDSDSFAGAVLNFLFSLFG